MHLPRGSLLTAAGPMGGETSVKRPLGISVLAIIFAAAGITYMGGTTGYTKLKYVAAGR